MYHGVRRYPDHEGNRGTGLTSLVPPCTAERRAPHLHLGAGEQDVVDLVLAPPAAACRVAGRVVQARQVPAAAGWRPLGPRHREVGPPQRAQGLRQIIGRTVQARQMSASAAGW